MVKLVILTPIAENDFENVIDYLTYNWGLTVVNNFVNRFEKIILELSKDAGRFPFVDRAKNVQKCILQSIIFYTSLKQIKPLRW